jgi:hypothetical protein
MALRAGWAPKTELDGKGKRKLLLLPGLEHGPRYTDCSFQYEQILARDVCHLDTGAGLSVILIHVTENTFRFIRNVL